MQFSTAKNDNQYALKTQQEKYEFHTLAFNFRGFFVDVYNNEFQIT